MFAPKLSKPQTKAPEASTSRPGLDRSALATHGFERDQVAQARFLQRTIGNQARLRLLAQQASPPDREISLKNTSISRDRRGPSFDFGKIPVFPPESASQAQPSFSPPPVGFVGGLQAKLEVGAVDDPLEREADRVAEQVMRMPNAAAVAPPAVRVGGIRGMQRKCSCGGTCPECRDEEDGGEHSKVQRKSTGPQASSPSSSPNNSGTTAPPIVNEVLRSPGRPLDTTTRSFMESRFANDFSDVRVHIDSQAAESAAAVRAHAYTVGKNVVFGAGKFAPASHEGKGLIAHELTHVLQQGETRPGTNGAVERLSSLPLAPSPTRLHPGSDTMLRRDPVNDPRTLKPSQDASQFHADEVKGSKHTYYRGEYETVSGPDGPEIQEVYWVKFNVDDKGVMTGSARTVSPDKKFRSGQLRFKDEFNKALDTFKKNGVEVNEFEADWSYMTPDEISDNLRVYQEAVKGGMTEKDAASNTPTGKVATKAGFKVVDVKDVPESQDHLAEQGVQRPRVKATFRRVPNQAPDAPPGGTGGGGKQPAQGGKTPVKPATPEETPSGAPPPAKGQGGVKAPGGTDVDPGGAGAGKSPQVKGQGGVKAPGGTAPEPETTGPAPPAGRIGGSGTLAIHVGAGVATVGLDWLAAYARMKVDAKIAQQQKDAFLAVATRKINANPDEAVKAMMVDPDKTVYAWIHLENTVISSGGVDPSSGDPTLNNSSPLFDLGPIEYVSAPVPPELANGFPKIGGGGLAPTVTRTIIIDVPLTTPPLEELIGYAKTRNMPLDDVYVYSLGQLQAAASSNESVLETNLKLLQARQADEDTWNKLDAQYKAAEKRHDLKLQVSIYHALAAIDQAQLARSAQINAIEKRIQAADENVKHWQRITELIKPTTP